VKPWYWIGPDGLAFTASVSGDEEVWPSVGGTCPVCLRDDLRVVVWSDDHLHFRHSSKWHDTPLRMLKVSDDLTKLLVVDRHGRVIESIDGKRWP
jgi:hypothetical protein